MKSISDLVAGFLLVYVLYIMTLESSPVIDALCETTATSGIYSLAECSENKFAVSMMIEWQRKLLKYISPENFAVCDEFGKTMAAFVLLDGKELSKPFAPNENTQTLFLWTYCIGEYHSHLFNNYSKGLVGALKACYFQASDIRPFFEPCFVSHPFNEWKKCMILTNQTSSE